MMPSLSPEPSLAIDLVRDPDEFGVMGRDTLNWWLGNGVTINALAKPWAVNASHVVYDRTGGYQPNPCGEFAHIFGALSTGGLVDLVAWSPRVGRIASRLGQAIVLGEQQAIAARDGITGLPLRVHRHPLGWLRAERRGIVIVDAERAGHLLSGLDLVPEDADHARELRNTLRVRPPRIIPARQRVAA